MSSLCQYIPRNLIFLVMIRTVYLLILHWFLVLETRQPAKDDNDKSFFTLTLYLFSYDLFGSSRGIFFDSILLTIVLVNLPRQRDKNIGYKGPRSIETRRFKLLEVPLKCFVNILKGLDFSK